MLFLKECKKVICSLTFVLYVAVVVVMYAFQFGTHLSEPVEAPREGAEWYGTKESDLPEVIMPAATESLVSEYLSGSYDAYPIMFYKQVKLKEKDSAKIADIIEELTGLGRQELDGFEDYEMGGYFEGMDESGKQTVYYRPPVLPEYELSKKVSYERFLVLMKEADDIIGGGSKYSDRMLLSNFGEVPMTYEDAVMEYEELMQEDHLAEGYLRLFCDYMGIDLCIIPIFVCVALWQADRRSRMEDLIYSRRISSPRLILNRYAALVFCMTVPVLFALLHAVLSIRGLYPELSISFGSAIGISLLWLLPAITMVTALGAFLTELISPLLAIFVQGAWWFAALESTELTGEITKWGFIIRHNSLGEAALFCSQYQDFLWNRSFYLVLSAVFVTLTILIYEWKRRR